MHVKLIELRPNKIEIEDFYNLYLGKADIVIPKDLRSNVDKAAETVKAVIKKNQTVYGINTGFGKLANTKISQNELLKLQKNLVMSHACGVGKPLSIDLIDFIMLLKNLSFLHGASGVRWELIEHIQAMRKSGIYPVIPHQGSVGASGDLAPLAHLGCAVVGEGKVHYKGEIVAAAKAYQKAGLAPFTLCAKEGLAILNGTQVSTSLALFAWFRLYHLLKVSLITSSMTVDAVMASDTPFSPEVSALRGHKGQIIVANILSKLLKNSQIRKSHIKNDERVQDPYSVRCYPQVAGPCLDHILHCGKLLEIESNGVTDNPIVVADSGKILSGGNFHAQSIGFISDIMALVISELGSISQRRIAMLVDPSVNNGLTPFLTPQPGINSGFMIAEVVSAALCAENKQKANPCSTDSMPTSANQEDHVSMATHAAYRLQCMLENLSIILGIELLIATEGIEQRRPLVSSNILEKIVAFVRQDVKKLEKDRILSGDLLQAASIVNSKAMIDQLEKSGIMPGCELI